LREARPTIGAFNAHLCRIRPPAPAGTRQQTAILSEKIFPPPVRGPVSAMGPRPSSSDAADPHAARPCVGDRWQKSSEARKLGRSKSPSPPTAGLFFKARLVQKAPVPRPAPSARPTDQQLPAERDRIRRTRHIVDPLPQIGPLPVDRPRRAAPGLAKPP